ncbi:hypothetical protein KK083_07610 [Fulvivirgaceae bacterium PWU4]|uniref:Uncharacterized protein n=2 Tax=Chryseosolibacter histidini TaxID=2782349 RepID=A0AAP2DID9_9BACT|nr:hypothetical protein [Chryseosolibacter histidini]
MLYGAMALFAGGILFYLIHLIRISTLKTYKEKYDYISRREIKNLEIIFILFAIGVAMLINRYGMDKIDEMGVWFFVRLFISFAGGTLVGYIAFLILEYYYPSRVDKKLKKWRFMPRVNPKTGNKMRLLAEHEEDVHMDEGMRAEEDVFSIDYDVWIDEQTNDVIVEKYQGHLQALQCGNCGFYTLKVVKEEITERPTINSPGELIKHYECSYCKSVRATAFKISTMEADDFKKEKHSFQNNRDVVLVKVEIKSATGGSKFYEFGDLAQAQKFLTEVNEEKK